jgi:hypothetical protein
MKQQEKKQTWRKPAARKWKLICYPAIVLLALIVLAPVGLAQTDSTTSTETRDTKDTKPGIGSCASSEIVKVLSSYAVKYPSLSNDDLSSKSPILSNNAAGIPSANPGGSINSQIGFSLGARSESRDRNAPYRETLQAVNILGKHFNALLGVFEQGSSLGGGVELSTANKLPLVELRAQALTSFKLYRRFVGEAYFRSLGDEKTHASLWFNYVRRTKDDFFGIGPRASDRLETNVSTEERSYNVSLYREFSKYAQVGVYGRLSNISAFRGEDNADTPIDILFSGNPTNVPTTNYLPGFNTNAKIYSLGLFAEVDKRDNGYGLPKGAYLYGRFGSYQGLRNGTAFSDYGWNELEIDARGYLPLFSDSTSLAVRSFLPLKDPKGGSQIPFYEQSFLGGRRYLRGFRNYRFRGNNAILFSVEPRRTVWKRSETKGMDIFGFGDAGQVWGDNRSAINPQILANDVTASQNWRFGIGGGVQYRMSKSMAFRIDLAHSNESNRVYLSLTRGF